MPDLADGESIEVQGSGSKPYTLKNVGGVYSCTCPAWRNQSVGIEQRTCKHLRALRGEEAEKTRLGGALPARPAKTKEGDAGPPLLLAESWDGALNLAGWWMSEKLDGVRAWWTGKEFLSRQGNIYHAPDWFVEGLPDYPLDGELWLGRKLFQRAVSIVRRQDKSEHWKDIRFLVFDMPKIDEPFEKRMKMIETLLKKNQPKYAQAHEHLPCKDLDHLQKELARIEELGGEGLMLRQPESRYAVGRSITLLKVKKFHDAEARVVGHQAGAGRHKGRLGALLVELADGTRFAVGTGFSDAQRNAPPALGSTIKFRYQELSDAGVPRFPSYVGVRTDIEVASTPATKTAPASKPVPPAAKPASSPAPTGAARRFEFVEGSSDKFWEIVVQGNDVITRYGKSGTNGQTTTKSFPDATAARKQADKLVAEKTGKGYVEVTLDGP